MLQELDITNFTAGELSKRMKGRIDQQKYFNGLDTEVNFVSMPQGGATKRPGSRFVALAKDQTPVLFGCRNVPFSFSVIQDYNLAITNGNARVYMDDAVVLSGGVPVDIAVPYTTADLPFLWFTQSADTLYIYGGNCPGNGGAGYPLATLTRSSHTNWTYSVLTIRDGPYLGVNTTGTTLTPSAVSGGINITASSIVGINVTPQSTGQGFLSTDVGRSIRIKVSAKWGWCVITAVNSTTSVNANVQGAVNGGADGALDGTTATVTWQLGKWSATTGYPYIGTFWQQRLFSLGTNNQPNAVEASFTADFTNMAPTADDGSVADNNALDWIISDDQVNALRWVSAAGSAQGAQLGMGTGGSEHIFQAATTNQALTPTNVQTYRETAYGGALNLPALRIGKSVLFANRPGRRVHEWTFLWQVNGYLGPDLLEWSEHISRPDPVTLPGIVAWCYQQNPHRVIWAVKGDGSLISFTYDKEQSVCAPSRHVLGGEWYGGPPLVESVACIPSPDGSYDEVWLSVLRTIGGAPTRTIEVLSRFFEAQPLDQAFFVDCGLTSPLTFPNVLVVPVGFTNSSPQGLMPQTMPPQFTGIGTLAASAAVFAPSDVNTKLVRLNGGLLAVTGFTDAQHVTAQVLLPMKSLAPAAPNAWSYTPLSTSFGNLGFLAGETIALLGDGAVLPEQVVPRSGTIAVPAPGVSVLTAGLPYSPVMVSMPFEPARVQAFAAANKITRLDTLWIRFHESLGCDYGRRETDDYTKILKDITDPLQSRSAADAMGLPPPLFSGAKRVFLHGSFDREGQVIVTQDEPLPLTVLSLFVQAEVDAVADEGPQ